MGAILLRLARFNELGHYTQSHPPGRQCRQPCQRGGRKRHTVVSSNARRQSVGGEQQMLLIGRAANPALPLLDEATEGLAPLLAQEIWRVIAMLLDEP